MEFNLEPFNAFQVFLEEIEQQVQLPTIRSFLKLYSTMPVEKLAEFLDMDINQFTSQLICLKVSQSNHATQLLVTALYLRFTSEVRYLPKEKKA